GKLLHQADDSEIIDQFLRLGQSARAQSYARAHHLDDLYNQRLTLYQQQLTARAEQAANSAALRAQNQLLREQNSQYQAELSRPYNSAPLYWNPTPNYWPNRRRDDHRGDGKPPANEPFYHPC